MEKFFYIIPFVFINSCFSQNSEEFPALFELHETLYTNSIGCNCTTTINYKELIQGINEDSGGSKLLEYSEDAVIKDYTIYENECDSILLFLEKSSHKIKIVDSIFSVRTDAILDVNHFSSEEDYRIGVKLVNIREQLEDSLLNFSFRFVYRVRACFTVNDEIAIFSAYRDYYQYYGMNRKLVFLVFKKNEGDWDIIHNSVIHTR